MNTRLHRILPEWCKEHRERYPRRDGPCVEYALASISGIPPAEWFAEFERRGQTGGGTDFYIFEPVLKEFFDWDGEKLYTKGKFGATDYWLRPTITQAIRDGGIPAGVYAMMTRRHLTALEVTEDGEWVVCDSNTTTPTPWRRNKAAGWAAEEYPTSCGARTRVIWLYPLP